MQFRNLLSVSSTKIITLQGLKKARGPFDPSCSACKEEVLVPEVMQSADGGVMGYVLASPLGVISASLHIHSDILTFLSLFCSSRWPHSGHLFPGPPTTDNPDPVTSTLHPRSSSYSAMSFMDVIMKPSFTGKETEL